MTTDILYNYYTMDIEEINKLEAKFLERVKKDDEDLYEKLEILGIKPRIYLLNWIITLFTRSMELDLVGRLWDVLFSHDLSERIVIEVCYQLLEVYREKILEEYIEEEEAIRILKSEKIDEIAAEGMFERIRKNVLR